jgi:CO/xanthine dehydrogenase Mo-binding subunit
MYISGTAYPVYPNDMPQSGVLLKLDRSGRVTVYSGASDIGQGVNTLLCQICAEELGCDPRDVTIVAADTDLTPVDLGAYSSRITFMVGLAAREACEKLADKLRSAVAAKVGCAPADVRLQLGTAASPQGSMSFAEACQLAEAAEGTTLAATGGYRTKKLGGNYRGGTIGASPAYSFTAHVAEVEVDEETGQSWIVRFTGCQDVGCAINPDLCEGQIQGSAVQGIGWALTEGYVYDERGLLRNPSLLDYRKLTSLDVPNLECILVEVPAEESPYGVRGTGEVNIVPTLAAVGNAIYDAIGVQLTETPFSAERVLAAMQQGVAPSRYRGVDIGAMLAGTAAEGAVPDVNEIPCEEDSVAEGRAAQPAPRRSEEASYTQTEG